MVCHENGLQKAAKDPYICCFTSAHEVLTRICSNETICKIANFPHMHMEVHASGRVRALDKLQITY